MRLIALLVAICAAAARNYPPAPGERVDARRLAVDLQGFVWVSGEFGTFRFDGVRYLPASKLGLPMTGTQHVAVTSDGTVWAQSERQLWRLDGGRFVKPSAGPIHSPIADAGPMLWVHQHPIGVYFRENGEWKWAEGPVAHPSLRLHGEPDGTAWLAGRFEPGKPSTVRWIRFVNGKFEEGERIIHYETLPAEEVAPAGESALFTSHKTETNRFVTRTGSPDFFHASRHVPVSPVGSRRLAGQGGEIWYEACGQWISSKGRSIAASGAHEVAIDATGGVWAAMGEKGLAYFPRHDVESFSLEEFPDRPVAGLSRLGERLFVARQDMTAVIERAEARKFCNGAPRAGEAMRLWGKTGAEAPITGIAANSASGDIWVMGKIFGISRMTADGKFAGDVAIQGGPLEMSNLRQAAFTADGRLWIASKSNLLEVRGPESAPQFPGVRYVAAFASARTGDTVAIADGALLRYTNGAWNEEPLPGCLLSQKPRAVAIENKDSAWYAYRDRTGFTHTVQGKCEHFEAANGFPGDTQFLAWDRKGRLWRGSSAGLFVRRSDSSWTRLRVPEGEMHQLFYEDRDGSVFVSMGDKLLRLPAQFADEQPPTAPLISHVESGAGTSLRPASLSFRLGDDVILHVSAIAEVGYGTQQVIEYRYDAGAWQPLEGHTLALGTAPRGAARVEMRYRGAEKTVTLPLSIAIPLTRSYWFYAAAAAVLAWLGRAGWLWFGRWQYQRQKRAFLANTPVPHENGALANGTVLHDRYRVERLIADGGSSHVYAARDERTGDPVVVKRIRAANASPDQVKRRFAQEVASVAMVRHEGIVPILDAWVEENGAPNLVMPRVTGPTLRERLRQGPFDPSSAMELLGKLASVLEAAHARGVVHSDFKPENVLLADDGPKVIDFGSSVLHMASGLSQYSRPAASLHYMAPEQLLGRYSKATDVYAFALVAMEVLTGRRYIDIDVPMNEDWEDAFLSAAVRELGLSTGQAEVFVDALRFDPERRAQDVAAWMNRLERA